MNGAESRRRVFLCQVEVRVKKFLFLVVVLGVIGLLGWRVYVRVASPSGENKRKGKKTYAVAVETAPIKREGIRDMGEFTGSLEPRSEFQVAPKIAGRLEKVCFHIGDKVKRGELIAALDDQELLQQINLSKAELRIAEARLTGVERLCPNEIAKAKADVTRWEATTNLCKTELDRLEKLTRKSVVSEADRDRAREKLLVAEAQLLGARQDLELEKADYQDRKDSSEAEIAKCQAALKSDQVKLSYTKMFADWANGIDIRVVGDRYVDEGAFLSPGDPIVSILDINELIAVIHVTEKDYPKLKVGQVVEIDTDAFPGKTFEGKIIRIAPLIAETSREARVDVQVPNQEHALKPGMFVRARIEFGKRDDALIVPRDAVVARGGKPGVFVIDKANAKATFVPVTLGIVGENRVEIIKPPLSGTVVTLGHHLLGEVSDVILPDDTP